MAKLYTQNEVEKMVSNKYNGEYKLISKYTKMNESALLLHLPCNKTFKVGRLKSFINENKCICRNCNPIYPTHNSRKRKTLKQFLNDLESIYGDEYTYLSGYKNSHSRINIKHNVCGKILYNKRADYFICKSHVTCKYCSNKNRGKYAIKNNYLNELLMNSLDGYKYEWLESYKGNNKIKHKILDKTTNTVYEIRPNDFQQGYRFDKKTSRACVFIEELFKVNNTSYIKEKKFIGCKDIYLLPFDYYIKSLNFIIEFDGSQHFNEKSFFNYENTHKHDMIKNDYIISKKINFIRLDYTLSNEVIKEIIEGIINNNLNIHTIKKYKLYCKYNKVIYNRDSYYKKFIKKKTSPS